MPVSSHEHILHVSVPAPTPPLAAPPSRAPRPAHADVRNPQFTTPLHSQAMLVVDSMPSPLHGHAPSLPAGWNWSLANTRLPALFQQLLNEANLHWAATLLPDHLCDTPPDDPLPSLPSALLTYADQIRIPSQWIPQESHRSRVHLIINGRQFPMGDLRPAIRLHRRSRCDVTLLDFHDSPPHAYDERLLLDYDGQVDRVARIYTPCSDRLLETDHTWPAIMILSAEAIARLADQPLPLELPLWPAAMLRAGLRLRGQSLPGRCYDLHNPHHAPQLAEAILRTRPHWLIDSGHLVQHRPRIWIGSGVQIAPTAHLIGPIAIGDHAQIGAEAVIVGPTIIAPGAHIPPGAHLRRCLLWPDPAADAQPAPRLPPHPSPRHPRSIRLQGVLSSGPARPLIGLRLQAYRFTKRAIDILGALLFMTITLPLWSVIALAIKLNSPGPVFYGHVRQGRGGKNFTCWKFRTMVPHADQIKAQLLAQNEVDGPQFKITSDPRIFRVGRLLRRLNIDEWPQFFNVLRGDMSLVGPRPSPERENQMCPAWREARLSVRPGLTGLWQIRRRRNHDTDFQEWIYYDLQYIRQQSLWLDLKILLGTLRVAFKGW